MSHIDPVWVNLMIMRQKRWERDRSDSKSCAEETERGGRTREREKGTAFGRCSTDVLAKFTLSTCRLLE